MKKAIKINIGGLVFHIDEDAYDVLYNYLEAINKQFTNSDEGDEIIADVEARIAELFQERLSTSKQVISIIDIEFVMQVIGQPQEFSYDEGVEYEDYDFGSKKSGRRMFRSPDEKILAGVCSGVAQYFSINILVVRLLFVVSVMFFGTGTLLYLILWAVIPEAKTTAQKLEMQGEQVNLSNIEKTIKEEFEQVSENIKDFKKSMAYSSIKDSISLFFKVIANFLQTVVNLVSKLFGSFFLLLSFVLLGLLISVLFFSDSFLSPLQWNGVGYSTFEIFHLFANTTEVILGILGLFIVAAIPLLIILYLSLRLIFKFKIKRFKSPLGFAFGIWIAGVLLVIFTGMKIASQYAADAKKTHEYTLETSKNGTSIYLQTFNENKFTDAIESSTNLFDSFHLTAEGKKMYASYHVDIQPSKDNKIHLLMRRMAHARSKKQAMENTASIKQHWQQNDSIINFEPYFTVENKGKWHGQSLKIILEIPLGQTLIMRNSMRGIIYDIQNVENMWDEDMLERRWIMTEDGLSLFEEKSEQEPDYQRDIITDSLKISFTDSVVVEVDSVLIEMKREMKMD